jgi:hypothetical protein
MKLKSIAHLLNTDEIMLECKGELASFEGKSAIEDMVRIFGEAEVIRITPSQSGLDIDISNNRRVTRKDQEVDS